MAIDLRREGHVSIVTIDNADSLNALKVKDIQTLADTWPELEADEQVRVVVVTGAGDTSFCSGANLKEFVPLLTTELRKKDDPEQALADLEYIHRAFLKKNELTKPLIAAVNGYCFAGGVELLNATDIRVAVEDAVFSLQEAKWGLFPAAGSSVRIPRQLPYPWAMEILLTGRKLTAQEALSAGLVNHVVAREELWPTVMKLAETIAANGPFAVQNIKRSVLACLNLPLNEAFAEETRYAARVFSSDDAVEGPRAFVEKRPPDFKGK